MDSYCERLGVELEDVQFRHSGIVLNPNDVVSRIGLEDGSIIVIVHLTVQFFVKDSKRTLSIKQRR
jgi:hypothetical protein